MNHVLVVDDEAEIRTSLEEILTRRRLWRSHRCHRG